MILNEPPKNKQKNKTSNNERIKLDQILKLLFAVSKPTLINTINGLFSESYNPNDVDISISKTATEYIKNNLDVIRADLFIQVVAEGISRDYHLEFQLSADNSMIFRMLEYDIQHALDNLRLDDTEELALTLSKSLVIHFTPSDRIPNKYKIKVLFSNGTMGEYEADVMKYWEYTDTALLDKKLYNLLSLQLFLLRIDFERATKAKDKQLRESAIIRGNATIDKIVNITSELHEEHEINSDDYNKIITGLTEIANYLDRKYKLNNKLSGGNEMIKGIADKNILKRVKELEEEVSSKAVELAKEMLADGEPIQKIVKYTKLTEDEIKDIKKTLTDKK